MISTFYKDHPEKPTAISPPLDPAPFMAKPSVKPIKLSAKQKQGHPTSSMKQVKEWDIGQWDFSFLVLVRFESFFINSVSFERDAHSASSSNIARSLSMSNTLPLCFLSISGTSPPIFRFFSSVPHQVRRFFIRLIFRFFFSIFYWVRRFFIYHALSIKLRKLHSCTIIHSAEPVS